jgi:hypothetical protein
MMRVMLDGETTGCVDCPFSYCSIDGERYCMLLDEDGREGPIPSGALTAWGVAPPDVCPLRKAQVVVRGVLAE